TWYVRIRETATRKPGEAAEVLIPKCTPPLVSAVQGLSYNGVPQILVTAGIPDEGSLYFAVTKSGAVEPAAGSYTTALPVKTDAGEYLVWYKIRSEAGETLPQNIRVDISKTYIDAACKTLSVNVCIGTEGMIEIDDKIPEQECRLSLVSSNESGVLDGKPTIIGRTIDYYTVNDPDKVGKNAWITVSVNDMVNYKNYDLLITLTAIQCDHVHTELRHVNGNKGDLCCADCNAVIQKGWSDPGGGGGGGGGETPPEEIYTVTVTDDGHGTGSASPASGKSGTEIRLSAYPAEAYVFKEWQLISGGVSIEGDAFILGEEDVVIRAVFEPEEGHIHNYTVEVTKEATCTEKGLKTYSCSCGDCYTEEIPALGHDYAEEITKEATTEEEGEICFTCRRCGHSYTEAIPKISDELLLYEKQNGTYELRLSKKLRSGESCILVPRFANGEVTNERVVWTSSDPDVAGVTQDGKLTAQRGGGTTITVRSEEKPDLTAYCVVTVTDPVTEISLDRKKVSLGTGESVTLSATVLPFVAEQELDWSANNEKVKIFVSEDGKSAVVTAAEEGNAKVTATARDGSGKKAVCSFTIGNPVPDFEIGGKGGAGEVKAGKSLTMQLNWKGPKPKNAELVWSVAAADGGDASCIAAISGKGVLSGIMAGKVTVTAVSVANPEKSASTVITVTAAEKKGAEITGISIANTDKFSEGLAAGKSLKCKTALTLSGSGKADKDAVAWYSSDSSIATVNRKGVVKAVAPGTVTITAIYRYAEDPETAPKDSLTFTVSASVKRVKADRKKLTLGTQEGSSCGKICIAAVLPVDATNPAIRWTANNKNVELAVVSAEGNASEGSFAAAGESLTTEAGYALAVRGLTPGVTKLTGVTVDGSKKKVSCTVTVRGRVTDLSLKTGNGKKGVNDVTDAGDGKYTSVMKAGGSMKLSPVLAINGVKNSGSTKKDYKKYKKYTDTTVSYRSSDTSVLTVDAKGKISVKKGVSGKTATVYVTSEDGKLKSEIVITVK
ncbi:MAG: Ig-like domain-containing protein, partial [Lachnospiraceae bacterium]|nr:Ig-like domain-containing protein [Lachnospiraceae bacterium]